MTVVVRLHVQPGARRTGVVGLHGDAIKVAVTAPADQGKANRAVCELVAGLVGVPPSAVTVVGGLTSRAKRVAIEGATEEQVGNALAPGGVARRRH